MSIATFTTEPSRVSRAEKTLRYLDLLAERCPEEHRPLLREVIAGLPPERLMQKIGYRVDLDVHEVQAALVVVTGERMREQGVDITQIVAEVLAASQPAPRGYDPFLVPSHHVRQPPQGLGVK